MGRDLPVLLVKWVALFVRQFLVLLVQGIGFVSIMLITTLFAVGRGIWEQSLHVATGWMGHIDRYRMDSRFENPMFWCIRFVSIFLMSICFIVLSHVLELLVKWILHV